MENIQANLQAVHRHIRSACAQCQVNPDTVRLLCVSKTKPVAAIMEAYASGERHFGESYAVEAAEKITAIKAQGCHDIVWHFIGPIQSNKTRLIAEHFDLVESVDRDKVAVRLNEQRPDELGPLDVLIEVNISNEEQKSGCAAAAVPALIELISRLPRLRLRGFMGIAKETDNVAEIEQSFALLQQLFEQYKNLPDFDILSMGMTHDLDSAIKFGSNEVRIGTAIFGAREYKNK